MQLTNMINSAYELNKVIKSLMFMTVAGALAACSATTPNGQDQQGDKISINDTIQHSLDNPQVASIWLNAEKARNNGQYRDAQQLIESALRFAPDDPFLWSRLAELNLRLDELVLAENYASKSNAIAGDNKTLKYRNWLIIEHARDERGDLIGAREAQIERCKYSACE